MQRVVCPWTHHFRGVVLHRPSRAGIASSAISVSCDGAPGQIRTADLRFRKPPLYPAELRARLACGPLERGSENSPWARASLGRERIQAGPGCRSKNRTLRGEGPRCEDEPRHLVETSRSSGRGVTAATAKGLQRRNGALQQPAMEAVLAVARSAGRSKSAGCTVLRQERTPRAWVTAPSRGTSERRRGQRHHGPGRSRARHPLLIGWAPGAGAVAAKTLTTALPCFPCPVDDLVVPRRAQGLGHRSSKTPAPSNVPSLAVNGDQATSPPVSNLALPSRVDAGALPRPRAENASRVPSTLAPARRRGLSTESCVQLVLYSVVAILLAFVALPRSAPIEPGGPAAAASGQLAALRAAIRDFRSTHGCWPPSLVVLVDGLHESLPIREVIAEADGGAHAAAPLADGPGSTAVRLLQDPINGLSTVWILSPEAPEPRAADGMTGWIYSPKTGQLWINALGVDVASGRSWFDF